MSCGDDRVIELYYQIYLGLKNYKKALKYLQEYTNNGTYYDDIEQIYTMALLKAKLGDTHGALTILNEIIDTSLFNKDTEMYVKALNLRKNLYQPLQVNIIFNIFFSRYH